MSRYLPLMRLGIGAMADLYLGVLHGAEGYRRPVVLKRAFAEGSADHPEARRALIEEARVASALNHPNVVHVYELIEAEEGLLLAMEYVAGVSVQALIDQLRASGGPMPWGVAGRIVADAARGLHHAHRATSPGGEPLMVVHRDVSPKNLVTTEEGITKVVDFGIARHALREVTSQVVVKGTPGYLSPEQATGRPLDHRTDVFALGVVLHELLSGKRLFSGGDAAATMRAVLSAPIPEVPAAVPAVVRDVLRRMLVRDPARRRVDMAEVASVLEQAGADDHRGAAAFVRAEIGPSLERRRERIKRLLAGAPPAGGSQGLREDWASLILIEAALDSDPGVAGGDGDGDDATTWVRAGGSGITALDEAPPTEVDPRRPGE